MRLPEHKRRAGPPPGTDTEISTITQKSKIVYFKLNLYLLVVFALVAHQFNR